MPRKARVLVPNCPHHIVQRGHNREAVFVTDQDYQYYLENLKEWKEEVARYGKVGTKPVLFSGNAIY